MRDDGVAAGERLSLCSCRTGVCFDCLSVNTGLILTTVNMNT